MPIRTPLHEILTTDYTFNPSTLETIDQALYDYVNEQLDVHSVGNDGYKKVPVIFSSPERSYDIKEDPLLRKNARTLDFPLISVNRTSLNKNPANKGRYGVDIPPYFSVVPQGSIPIARRLAQKESQERANATAIRTHGGGHNTTYQTFPIDNKEAVYETLYVTMPAFVEVSFEIKMISNFQSQMNEMITPFMTKASTPAVTTIQAAGHRYEAFTDPNFSNESSNSGLGTDERVFKTTISIKVLGYLLGSDTNEDAPLILKTQSATKVTVGRERVVVGDELTLAPNRKDKYRR